MDDICANNFFQSSGFSKGYDRKCTKFFSRFSRVIAVVLECWTFQVCNVRHPTILHGIKIEKKRSKRGTDEVASTLSTAKSQDEVKWSSINTGPNVISMCTVPLKIKESSGNKVIYTFALLDSCSQLTSILNQWRDHICIPGRETSVLIKTINGEFKIPSKATDGLQVSCINDDKNLWERLPHIRERWNFSW